MNNLDYTLRKDWPLTDDQNDIIDFMLHRAECICAAQTGFGKTYLGCTAICHILLKYQSSHAIILVPQKAIKAFKRELSEKLRVSYNTLTSDTFDFKENNRITLMTHTSLKKYIDYIKDIKKSGKNLILLVDEAHIFSCKESKIYQLMLSIRNYFSICYMMTATPLKNNIEGLFWLFTMLDYKIFGPWDFFKNNYLVTETHKTTRMCGKGNKKTKKTFYEEEVVGYKNLPMLKQILDKFIIIKQKHYNLEFIYNKIELTPDEIKPYLNAGAGLLRATAKDSFAVRVHDLQQVVDNINKDYKIIDKLSSKEQLFIKLIYTKIKDNHPTLVYCDYNEVVDRLCYILDKTKNITGVKQILQITGNISLKKRERVENLIDNNTVVLITSAGTESVNLQKADSLIFYDIPFSILTFIQAVGRITRMDSKYNKQYIHILEAVGTIDSYKRYLVQINGGLIMNMFGKIETLPLDVGQIDKNITRQLRHSLLWCFKQKRLLTEEELQNLISITNKSN